MAVKKSKRDRSGSHENERTTEVAEEDEVRTAIRY